MNIGTWTITDAQGHIVTTGQMLDLAATGLNEVLQNVMIILSTRVGEVMLDRRFGLYNNFVDVPQGDVFHMMVVEQVCRGLAFFEPRAKFKDIQFTPDLTQPGTANVQLSVGIDVNELTVPSR